MRVKTLSAVVMVLVASAVAASSAVAQWEGNPVSAQQIGSGTFTLETGISVKCEKAVSSKGVKNTTTILNLGPISWGECTAAVGESKIGATVECEELTLEQPAKEGPTKGKATGKVVKTCTVKLNGASCTISVAGGAENQKLATTTLGKVSVGQEDKVNVSPIKATTSGAGCTVAGLKAIYTEASLVSTLVVHGSPFNLI